MSIFKTKKFKSLLLLPLAAFAVATPILMTSCGSNSSVSVVDNGDNVSDNNNSNDNTDSTNDSSKSSTENYSNEQMVEQGTNNTELSENQKVRQNNKANSALNDFKRYIEEKDLNNLQEEVHIYVEKEKTSDAFYDLYHTQYTSLLTNEATTDEQFKDFWLIVAKAYKDVGFEYGFVSKSDFIENYKTDFEGLITSDQNKHTEIDNYSYTAFIYETYKVAFWGDYMNFQYLNKVLLGGYSYPNKYSIPIDIAWYQKYAKGNLRTEIDKYDEIYQTLISDEQKQ